MDAAALLCNICPKRPTFSDVSHLLTHVSSKGHLSNYFKLQVRSHQEEEAGDLLDEYDLWYKENNLPKLLSDRMASKEARKKQGKHSKHGPGYSVMKTMKQPTPKEAVDPLPSEPLSTNFIEPHLSDSYLTMDGDSTLSENYIAPATPSDFDSRTYIPPISPDYPLPPTASSPERPPSRPWKYECESEPENDAGSFLQTIPIWDGRLRNRSGTGCPLIHRELSYDPFIDDKSALNLCATGMEKERSDEMARLKGVLWPGMDIFDSATEQMRRKRNQKKDESILKMMETSSMCVEPTELVFSPTGILRKQRVISGNVEEDSPLPGESPLPKRISRPKRVLSQADPNAYYGHNKKRNKSSTGHHSDRQFGGQPRRSARISRAVAPQLFRFRPEDHYSCECDEDGDDDFDLVFRGLDPKPRRRLSVFQDEPDDICNADLKNHHNQANPRPGASMLSRQNSLPRSSFQSETHSLNPRGTTPCVTADKENIEPLFNLHDRVEPSFTWNSPPSKRRYASGVAYPPQFFFDDCPRVEFGPFGRHHEPPGYIYNPLAVSLPNLHEEDYIYFANAHSKSHKETSVTRGPSPDATIPEMEDDEFERFCFNGNFSL